MNLLNCSDHWRSFNPRRIVPLKTHEHNTLAKWLLDGQTFISFGLSADSKEILETQCGPLLLIMGAEKKFTFAVDVYDNPSAESGLSRQQSLLAQTACEHPNLATVIVDWLNSRQF